jgi:uncharacterized pyridoxamine 5'-phosphate oxidase family protein
MTKTGVLIQISDLFKSQKLAVLSTFDQGQPYCNLVAFAESNDCKFLVFATNRNTNKYRNLLNNRLVSLLIDDRTNLSGDFNQNLAITVLGSAEEVASDEKPCFNELLISKNPNITSFVNGADNTLFKVMISDYIIAGFNSVEKLHIED